MRLKFFVAAFVLTSLLAGNAAAADDALHESVDKEYRHQRRWQSEINIYGGDFLGDEWHNSWDAGAKYYMHINNTFAVGASYLYTPIYADSDSTFARSLTTKNTHIINAELTISNDAAFRAGSSVIECDFFLTLGAGTFWINGFYEPMGMIGGGVRVYTPVPWFALRADVNNYIHPTPIPVGDTINADIAFNLGVSFMIPPRKSVADIKEEKMRKEKEEAAAAEAAVKN